jgi:lysozyme
MIRKPVFDAVRRLLGRALRQREVEAIDRALDVALAPESPNAGCGARACATSARCRAVSEAGIALIKRFEGCARRRPDGMVEAYPDPGTGGAPWTIGWGATGPDVGPGTLWSQAACDARLVHDLGRHAAEVAEAIGDAPTSQGQFDALVSFHFNTGAIFRATLTRRHVAGDHAAAAAEFARWNRAGGRVLRGLTRRRAAEAALYREARA